MSPKTERNMQAFVKELAEAAAHQANLQRIAERVMRDAASDQVKLERFARLILQDAAELKKAERAAAQILRARGG